MKLTVIAWLQFILGLVILGAVDYAVRWQDGWLGRGGMPTPEVIWFGVPLLLGLVAVVLLWRSTVGIQRLWVRLIAVGAQVVVGFLIYAVVCLWYVIGTGVDSL